MSAGASGLYSEDDQLALQIEKRLEELESAESWEKTALHNDSEPERFGLAVVSGRVDGTCAE
jgi:hypothetical protein